MFKRFDILPLVFICVNMGYVFMLSVVNTELSPYFRIFLPSIFIVAPAVYLKFLPAVFVAAFSALIVENSFPLDSGLIPAVWISAAALAHLMRFRFRGMDFLSLTAIMELFNFAILFLYSVLLPSLCRDLQTYLLRVLADMGGSAVVLSFVGAFSIRLPVSLMRFLGRDIYISELKE